MSYHHVTTIAFTYEPYDDYYADVNMTSDEYVIFEQHVQTIRDLIKNQNNTFFGQILGAIIKDDVSGRVVYIGCMFWGNENEMTMVGDKRRYSKIYVSLIENDPCTEILKNLNIVGTYTIETDEFGRYWYNKQSVNNY